jgi:hypothetical protein
MVRRASVLLAFVTLMTVLLAFLMFYCQLATMLNQSMLNQRNYYLCERDLYKYLCVKKMRPPVGIVFGEAGRSISYIGGETFRFKGRSFDYFYSLPK